ncbi:MAG: hypothetical protein K0R57_6589 [Paenibacillaceae bacterium]|nr:hypothetical protein [Paenibacillaceae bacterium]
MLNIRDLTQKGGPVAISETFDLSETLAGRVDTEAPGKLAAELTAHSQGGLVTVEGTLRFAIRTSCSRCLQPIEETFNVPFREQFATRPEAVPNEDKDEVHLIAEDHIKLDSYVEEAVWLALPLAAVCREDCRGLCPECGANQNDGPCGCNKDKIDPRLAGLANFFES